MDVAASSGGGTTRPIVVPARRYVAVVVTSGPSVAYEAVQSVLGGLPIALERDISPDTLADGAGWMLTEAVALARSSSRPRELLDAAAAVLVAPGELDPVSGPAWALYLVVNELTGQPGKVDAALTDGLVARPEASWTALARTLAVLATLHDGDHAGRWLQRPA